MRVFMTGATGFIGGRVAAALRDRSDKVVALVRSPEKAGALRELGCEARVPRILYVSSVVVFGNTEGQIVDEGFRRTHRRFATYYEETKVLAHEIADERIARGAPIVMVQPGSVYGPGDHSELGEMVDQSARASSRPLPTASWRPSTRVRSASPTCSAASASRWDG